MSIFSLLRTQLSLTLRETFATRQSGVCLPEPSQTVVCAVQELDGARVRGRSQQPIIGCTRRSAFCVIDRFVADGHERPEGSM